MDLYKRLRTRKFIHQAWFQVRATGLDSLSDNTKRQISDFEKRWLGNTEKIQTQLREGTFSFSGEIGHTPPKGNGKPGVRPIVIAPIANRIVRRAVLDLLQGDDLSDECEDRWNGIPEIVQIMSTPTSVGGIRGRGVPHGLAVVDNAVLQGKIWFVRSDIRDFFTRIPRDRINDFVRKSVSDDQFSQLFREALNTSLENQAELEERNLFKLFPDERTGVAQGSALSALAGNVALNEFDLEMNSRGLICVRYIDDFILLGSNETAVQRGYKAAREMLKSMGMNVYELEDSQAKKAGKVDAGNIYRGTDFLGYRISGHSRQPCQAARRKFLDKVNDLVREARKEMRRTVSENTSFSRMRYHQSMVKLNHLVWGWSQSFKHTTAMHVFQSLDRDVYSAMSQIHREALNVIVGGRPEFRRRVLGVHLLTDTKKASLPPVAIDGVLAPKAEMDGTSPRRGAA